MRNATLATQAQHLTQIIARVLQRYEGARHADEIRQSALVTARASMSPAEQSVRQQEDPAVIQQWLTCGLASARHTPQVDSALLDSLEQMLPHAHWIKRNAAPGQDAAFVENHRHALLTGNGSPVTCEALTLGLAVMAPHTRYPFHQHPPREFYIVLSAGQWYQEGYGWWEPGPGGLLYNEPSLVHSMQSGAAPLLALWGLLHEEWK